MARNQRKIWAKRTNLVIRTFIEDAVIIGTFLPHLELQQVCCPHLLHAMEGAPASAVFYPVRQRTWMGMPSIQPGHRPFQQNGGE